MAGSELDGGGRGLGWCSLSGGVEALGHTLSGGVAAFSHAGSALGGAAITGGCGLVAAAFSVSGHLVS